MRACATSARGQYEYMCAQSGICVHDLVERDVACSRRCKAPQLARLQVQTRRGAAAKVPCDAALTQMFADDIVQLGRKETDRIAHHTWACTCIQNTHSRMHTCTHKHTHTHTYIQPEDQP